MAITAKKSPWFYSGPNLELNTVRAVDSQTWKAGQWGYLTSTGKIKPMASLTTSVYGIFAESRASSTSVSDVKVYRIPSSDCKFVGYLAGANTDLQALQTHVGARKGAAVASNVLVVSNDSKVCFKIVERMFKVEPYKNDSSTAPYKVIFSVLDTALTA